MTFRVFMMATTLISCSFGLAFLLFPATMSGLYGTPFSPSVAMLDRFFGSALFGLGLFAWALKDANDAALILRLLIAHAVHDAIGCAVAAYATASGVLNAMGWSSVFVYLALAVGCGVVYRSLPAMRLRAA